MVSLGKQKTGYIIFNIGFQVPGLSWFISFKRKNNNKSVKHAMLLPQKKFYNAKPRCTKKHFYRLLYWTAAARCKLVHKKGKYKCSIQTL
jgi:hypothetical protein